jgi:hypothetical protein
MANHNKQAKDRESFMLEGKLSELDWIPKSEEQISKDLFQGSDPEKVMDAFEEQLGLTVKETAPKKQVYKCMDLRPFDDEDRLLLQKFYNNPEQYEVIRRSENWTQRGELIIFLEYFENLDVKLDKEREENPIL